MSPTTPREVVHLLADAIRSQRGARIVTLPAATLRESTGGVL